MEKLRAKEILGNRGYHAAETVFLNNQETFRHTHEFYEILIMSEGEVYHLRNQRKEFLVQNSLCLVKPDDVHSFQKGQSKSAHFLNLAFSIENFEKVWNIFQKNCEGRNDELKSHVRIPGGLAQALSSKIMYLMRCMIQEGEIPAKELLMGILLESFIYLKNQKTSQEMIPDWLEYVHDEMRKKENYMEGISRFVELSGKSQEHLIRMMKKYYKITPSAYLNYIRLEQAALLLRTTENNVLDIMLRCGYNNVSYFNQRFKEEYGTSPSRYRKFNRAVIDPD